MPYIKKEDRQRLTGANGKWNCSAIKTAGELNYLLTKLALSDFWETQDNLKGAILLRTEAFFEASDKKYQNHNDVIGALMGCMLEFSRRFAAAHRRPSEFILVMTEVLEEFYVKKTAVYEDQKIIENGDVTNE